MPLFDDESDKVNLLSANICQLNYEPIKLASFQTSATSEKDASDGENEDQARFLPEPSVIRKLRKLYGLFCVFQWWVIIESSKDTQSTQSTKLGT